MNVDWDRLLDGNFKEAWQNFAHGSNFDPTGVTRHLAPLTALLAANDIDPGDPGDLLSPRRTALRREFFASWDKPIVPILVNMSQSDSWQSRFYPCKKSALVAARLDRHETYDPLFLRWHWRLGAEQLLYSHQSNDAKTPGQARYLSNTKPMLLACGTEDRILFNDICGATQRTAPYMTETPGKALFLLETGHSVDVERREYFARQIIQFLDVGAQPAPKKPDGAACVLPNECQSNRCQFFRCEAQPPGEEGQRPGVLPAGRVPVESVHVLHVRSTTAPGREEGQRRGVLPAGRVPVESLHVIQVRGTTAPGREEGQRRGVLPAGRVPVEPLRVLQVQVAQLEPSVALRSAPLASSLLADQLDGPLVGVDGAGHPVGRDRQLALRKRRVRPCEDESAGSGCSRPLSPRRHHVRLGGANHAGDLGAILTQDREAGRRAVRHGDRHLPGAGHIHILRLRRPHLPDDRQDQNRRQHARCSQHPECPLQ